MTDIDKLRAGIALLPELKKMHPGMFYDPPTISMDTLKTIIAALEAAITAPTQEPKT